MAQLERAVFGFDSAWTDSPRSPGALCLLEFHADGTTRFHPPKPASFQDALDDILIIAGRANCTLVAIDQPTIVPNLSGCRPAERVASSVISWIGGGVQPANRSRLTMFGPQAPIWRFKSALNANDNPFTAQTAAKGLHLIEVFPALALPTLGAAYCGRLAAPKYNPANRRKFRLADWRSVCCCLSKAASGFELPDVRESIEELADLPQPEKRDQDRLDALICLFVALVWRDRPRKDSIVIGDVTTGYIVSPASAEVRRRLETAAKLRSIPIDGTIPDS